MATDKVICPQCGAENMASPLITICSSCLGSLEGAQLAPEPEPAPPPAREPAPPPEPPRPVEEPPVELVAEPDVVDAEPEPVPESRPQEPPPPPGPPVPEPPALPEPDVAEAPAPARLPAFEPLRSPELETQPPPPAPEPPAAEPPAPPKRESFQPARSDDIGPVVSGPLYAELPSRTEPADFQPARSDVPPLEVPRIPSGPAVSLPEPHVEAQPEGSPFQPIKIICPNCHAANPPHFHRCNLCSAELPDAQRDSAWAEQWGTRPDRVRGSTAGQTKWGAACGCLVMGFIFFVLILLSALR